MKRFCGLRSVLLIIIAGLSKLKKNIVLNSFQHGYQQKNGTYLQVINIPPQAQPEGGVTCKPPQEKSGLQEGRSFNFLTNMLWQMFGRKKFTQLRVPKRGVFWVKTDHLMLKNRIE